MAFLKNSANLSTIFEPRGISAKRADVNYLESGTDISNTYYSLTEGGTSPADCNYHAGGTDLSALFAGIGTVSYENLGNLFIDGQGTITDENGTHTITAVGNAAVSIAQYCPYNSSSSSIIFNGTGNYLNVPDHADWDLDSGDFTIDMFVRFNNVSGIQGFATQYSDGYHFWRFFTSSGNLKFDAYDGGAIMGITGSGWSPSINTWYHIAVTRSGNDYKLFSNGSVIGTSTDSDTIGTYAALLQIGIERDNSGYFTGYIDNFRVVNGTALWTANFNLNDAELLYG